MKITVAGSDNDAIKRPTEMQMDQKRGWAIYELQRCDPPQKRAKQKENQQQKKKSKPARSRSKNTSAETACFITDGVNLRDFLAKKSKLSKDKTQAWLSFCTLEVTTGSLWAGDPLVANADDGCVAKVPRGRYVVEGIGTAQGKTRTVSKLRVRLESVENPTLGKEVGETGTDSAMMGVADIKAFDKACRSVEGDEVQVAIESQIDSGFGIITVEECPGAAMPFVPIGSDGGGPVFALMSGRKCVGIELPFVGEDQGEVG